MGNSGTYIQSEDGVNLGVTDKQRERGPSPRKFSRRVTLDREVGVPKERGWVVESISPRITEEGMIYLVSIRKCH